jgi:putative membrane protein
MKTFPFLLIAMSLLIWACNNEAKDSVEKADSINKASIDSPAAQQPAVTADEATSSFLVKATNGGMTEVKLGEIAQQNAASKRVKEFGSMMVHDHSATNEKVKALAAQRNVTLPTSVSDESQRDIDDCSKKTGREFDKAYMSDMVKKHQATIDMFEDAADKSKDADVKTFINNTLPKVREHLDSAKAIQKQLK